VLKTMSPTFTSANGAALSTNLLAATEVIDPEIVSAPGFGILALSLLYIAIAVLACNFSYAIFTFYFL